MTIDDLPIKSVSDMTEEELMQRIMELRQSRRTVPARKAAKKNGAKKSTKISLDNVSSMDAGTAAALVAMLEGIVEGEGE